jgi:hypothetical protein
MSATIETNHHSRWAPAASERCHARCATLPLNARLVSIAALWHGLECHVEAMGALLVGLGAVPVRKTGHAGLSTDSRAAPGARVRAVISGSSGRAEPFKKVKGVTTLPIEHDTVLLALQL